MTLAPAWGVHGIGSLAHADYEKHKKKAQFLGIYCLSSGGANSGSLGDVYPLVDRVVDLSLVRVR